MMAIALLLAASQPYSLVKAYPGWELYRYDRGCALRAHFVNGGTMQIAADYGANRVYIDVRDGRLKSVEDGRPYPVAPIPVRAGTPDLRFAPLVARGISDGVTQGYAMTLKGDAILGSMKRSERIGFAVPGGRKVMTLNYGTIAGQVGDLRWCARQVQRNALGSSGFSVVNWFGTPPMDFPPR